jgi:cold shock protein
MQEGTVIFFDVARGSGLIKPNNGGADIFVHHTGLIDPIEENDQVVYEVEDGKKGLRAIRVRVF